MARLQPQKYAVEGCSQGCTLGQRRSPIFQEIHGWFEAGDNNDVIVEKAKALDYKISAGAAGRHRRQHLVPIREEVEAPKPKRGSSRPGNPEKANHLEFLEDIIARGAATMKAGGYKISPEMALRALDTFYRLTQGNAQQQWVDEMTAAIEGIDLDGLKRDDPAIESEDEAAQAVGV